MKVYYSFAIQKLEDKYSDYEHAVSFLKRQGHKLTREWLDDAIERLKTKKEQPSRSGMYTSIMSAIKKSDVCIFDVTGKAMSIGQQIMHAIDIRKPTLVLADINASTSIHDLFIAGSQSNFLTLKDYKNKELMIKIIDSFLEKSEYDSKARVTVYLEDNLYQKLHKKSFKENIPRSEIIEQLILKKPKIFNQKKLNLKGKKRRLDLQLHNDVNEILISRMAENGTTKTFEIKKAITKLG